MTEEELDRIPWLEKEIQILKERLERLEDDDLYRAHIHKLVPRQPGRVRCRLAERVQKAEELRAVVAEREAQKAKAERFIEDVEDIEVRIIMRLRHMEDFTWEEIAHKLDCERRRVKRKYRKFIEKG